MNDGELAIEWIESLAKNEFAQVNGKIASSQTPTAYSGFCCLGEARWLLGMDASDVNSIPEFYRDPAKPNGGVWEGYFLGELTEHERDELGLHGQGMDECIHLNDQVGMTFPEIARALVSTPGKFFNPDVAEAVKEHFYSL